MPFFLAENLFDNLVVICSVVIENTIKGTEKLLIIMGFQICSPYWTDVIIIDTVCHIIFVMKISVKRGSGYVCGCQNIINSNLINSLPAYKKIYSVLNPFFG